MGIALVMSNAIHAHQNIYAQGDSIISLSTKEHKLFLYIPESEFVVNPFPNYIFNLIQPLDSLSSPKGILNIKYDNLKTDIILAKDWSTITIKQYVDGSSYKIPFTADVEWYLRKYNERKSYAKFIQLMHQSAKDAYASYLMAYASHQLKEVRQPLLSGHRCLLYDLPQFQSLPYHVDSDRTILHADDDKP